MSEFLRVAWLVVRKDLRVESRSRELLLTTVFFAVSCILVFSFGFVRRASHCHHTPHALIPHNGPVTSPISPKTTASSAAATARRSAAGFRRNRYCALETPSTKTARNIAIQAGKWK